MGGSDGPKHVADHTGQVQGSLYKTAFCVGLDFCGVILFTVFLRIKCFLTEFPSVAPCMSVKCRHPASHNFMTFVRLHEDSVFSRMNQLHFLEKTELFFRADHDGRDEWYCF